MVAGRRVISLASAGCACPPAASSPSPNLLPRSFTLGSHKRRPVKKVGKRYATLWLRHMGSIGMLNALLCTARIKDRFQMKSSLIQLKIRRIIFHEVPHRRRGIDEPGPTLSEIDSSIEPQFAAFMKVSALGKSDPVVLG